MRCATCENTYHPTTGHAFSASTVLCGVCAIAWARWVKATLGREGKRSGGLYEAATSVRAA
jgi:hypothetical protein